MANKYQKEFNEYQIKESVMSDDEKFYALRELSGKLSIRLEQLQKVLNKPLSSKKQDEVKTKLAIAGAHIAGLSATALTVGGLLKTLQGYDQMNEWLKLRIVLSGGGGAFALAAIAGATVTVLVDRALKEKKITSYIKKAENFRELTALKNKVDKIKNDLDDMYAFEESAYAEARDLKALGK